VTATDFDDDGNPTGTSVDAAFTWTVNNPVPVAADDSDTTDEDSAISRNAANGVIDPNDIDTAPDGDTLEVDQVAGADGNVATAVTGSTGGQFTIAADGSYDFDPDGDFEDLAVGESRQTQVSYRVTDNEGGADTATLTVTVNGVNDAPTGTPADRNAVDGESINIDVGAAFSDVDTSDTLTFATADLPGGLTIDANTGVVTGTIDNDASQGGPASDGVYTVTVTVTDSQGSSIDRDLTWTVTNPAPVADDDTDTVQQGDSLNRGPGDGVLVNDADGTPDSDPLAVTSIDNGATSVGAGVQIAGDNGGTFIIAADGGFSFDTAGDFIDVARGDARQTAVTYTVSDGQGGAGEATLSITVTGDNETPISRDIPDDRTPFGAPYANDVSDAFDDIDIGDSLSFSTTGLPDGLSIDPQTGEIAGIPLEFGRFEVTVTATDDGGAAIEEPFLLEVTPPAPYLPPDDGPAGDGTPRDPGIGQDDLLADPGFAGLTIEFGLPDLLRRDGLGSGLEIDTTSSDAERVSLQYQATTTSSDAERVSLQYQATRSDGSPLPAGLTVDTDTGEIKGRLPAGMDRAELRVIGIDEKGDTRTHEVVVDRDGNIVARGTEPDGEPIAGSGYHRMEVGVDSSGRVVVISGRESDIGMVAETIRVEGGRLDISLADTKAAEVIRYSGRMTSGEALPAWLRVDPESGRIRGELPVDVQTLSVKVIAEEVDGGDRTLQIDLRLEAAQGAVRDWQSLDGQIQAALGRVGDGGDSARGERLLAALGRTG